MVNLTGLLPCIAGDEDGVDDGLTYLTLKLGTTPLIGICIGFVGAAIGQFIMAYYQLLTPSSSRPVAATTFSASLLLQLLATTDLFSLLLSRELSVWSARLIITGASPT